MAAGGIIAVGRLRNGGLGGRRVTRRVVLG